MDGERKASAIRRLQVNKTHPIHSLVSCYRVLQPPYIRWHTQTEQKTTKNEISPHRND